MSGGLSPIVTWRFAPASSLGLAIVGALILQHVYGWLPCALCISQRLTALGLFAMLLAWAATSKKAAQNSLLFLGLGLCLLASYVGFEHIRLTTNPAAGCAPGLSVMLTAVLESTPWLAWLLDTRASCADSDYRLLGIPLPVLSVAAHWLGWGWATVLAFKRKRV